MERKTSNGFPFILITEVENEKIYVIFKEMQLNIFYLLNTFCVSIAPVHMEFILKCIFRLD